MKDVKLSIVIPVFNKNKYTLSALNDLFKLPIDHEIIIIDNASTDETQSECLKINRSNFIYIRNEKNEFHSKACNQGYEASSSNNVLFLNNDIRIKSNYENWTDELISNCRDSLVGPTMGLLDNSFNFIKEANEKLIGNSYLSGWCVASSKDNWNKLKLSNNEIWNEKFPMYFNDADLSFRAKQKSLELKVITLPVVHFGKISSSQLNINKLYNDGKKEFVNKWKNQKLK